MKTSLKRDELLDKQVLNENCQQEKVKLLTEFKQVKTIVDTFTLSSNETPELRSKALLVFLTYFGFANAEEWVHKIVWKDSTELQEFESKMKDVNKSVEKFRNSSDETPESRTTALLEFLTYFIPDRADRLEEDYFFQRMFKH